MKPLLARWIGGGFIVLSLGSIGFVPLFSSPGYEYALAAGLLCPVTTAAVTCLELAARPRQPFTSFCRGVANGLRFAVVAYLVSLFHGLRSGFCDLLGGSLLFVLGPGIGCVLAGLWGAATAEVATRCKRPRRRTAAAVVCGAAGPIAGVLVQLGWFYSTPIIFAYDPFVGYFSGALYDTVLDPSGLLSYRAASVATLFACYVAALHLQRASSGRLGFRSLGRPGLLLLGVICALASVLSVLFGSALGHWQTSGSISTALGAELRHGHCHVAYASSIELGEARRFARDCDAHVETLGRWFGATDPAPVRVFLFTDTAQKRRLMGAENTAIAKPWRREIYLNDQGYPHRTLGHELAHVLAGQFGRGPFKIAGSLAGWLPNPGLIEGVAVAAAPRGDDLTLTEWAKAMRDIGVLPKLHELFALSFLGQHSATAYTAAGAFVTYVRQRFGAGVIRSWYAGQSLPDVVGESWTQLEQAWYQHLDQRELSEAARRHAKARFDRPGVFGRKCPHVVDETVRRAALDEAIGDLQRALAAYERVLQLDPHSKPALFGRVSCHDRLGQTATAIKELKELADDDVGFGRWRQRALERLGDLALRQNQVVEARDYYHQARAYTVDEDRLRTLDIKQRTADDEVARVAIVALLVGGERGPDLIEALDRLGRWRQARPTSGLPDYLLARQYFHAQNFELAAVKLDDALAKNLQLPRVLTETLRLRLITACALGDGQDAETFFQRYVSQAGLSRSRVDDARSLLARCRRPRQ